MLILDPETGKYEPTPKEVERQKNSMESQLALALSDAQLKISDQQAMIDQLAMAITDLQIKQGGVA